LEHLTDVKNYHFTRPPWTQLLNLIARSTTKSPLALT